MSRIAMSIEQQVLDIIHETFDPFLQVKGKNLNIKTVISEEENQLNVHLSVGFPSQLLRISFVPELEAALTSALPLKSIEITADHFIKAHRTQLVGQALRGIKNTIAIASGKGGVGKSTVAVNLAVALSRAGARVGILDADIYGPSIPLMLGKTETVQVQEDKYLPVQAHGVQAMSIGYLTDPESALIWRGPMLAKSMIQMLDSTHWNELDYLLIDLPPGTGDIQLSLVQKIPLTAAIIVTTPQHVATLDAQKAIQMFERTGIHVLGLVENMAIHHCTHCGHTDTIFGEGGAEALAKQFNSHLLGKLPLDANIVTQSDQGTPTAAYGTQQLSTAFMKTALQAALLLSHQPINYAGKIPPIVTA